MKTRMNAIRARERCTRLFALLFFVCVSSSCDRFYDQTVDGTETITAYDNRMPEALEELWQSCHAESEVTATDDTFNLLGSCVDPPEGLSADAALLLLMLAAEPEYELSIPNVLYEDRANFADFPWPLQNCYVRTDTEVRFRAIAFETLSAEWVTRQGRPAFRVALRNPSFGAGDNQRWAPAIRDTIAAADCPSLINETILEEKLDNSGVDGTQSIRLRDFDVTLYFKLIVAGSINNGVYSNKLKGEVDVVAEVEADDDTLGIDWNKLPDEAREELEGSVDLLEDEIESLLANELKDVAKRIADEIQKSLPSNHRICSAKADDGVLTIRSAVSCPLVMAPIEGPADLTVAITDKQSVQIMTTQGDVAKATLKSVSFTVSNEATFLAPANQVVLKRNGRERARMTVPVRTPYPTIGSTFKGTFEDLNEELLGSKIEWTVEVDADDEVAESNERNNTDAFETDYRSPPDPTDIDGELTPDPKSTGLIRRLGRLRGALELTDDQNARIREIFESEIEASRRLAREFAWPVSEDQRSRLARRIRAIEEETDTRLRSVLSDRQQQRLREVDRRFLRSGR